MKNFARFMAVILFVQGAGPVLLLGAWRSGGWFLLCVACVYTLLAGGLWAGRRWALPLALAFTLAQIPVVSSWLFSWRLSIGTSFGMGICPAWNILDAPVFRYHTSVDAILDCAFFHRNTPLVAAFAGTPSETFFCINGFAALVLGLLTALLSGQRQASRKISMPGRTQDPTLAVSTADPG